MDPSCLLGEGAVMRIIGDIMREMYPNWRLVSHHEILNVAVGMRLTSLSLEH